MSRLAAPGWRQWHTKHLPDPRWNMPPQYGTHTPILPTTSIPQQIECEWDAATSELATARSPKTTSETCHAVQDPSWHGNSQQRPIPNTSCQNLKAHPSLQLPRQRSINWLYKAIVLPEDRQRVEQPPSHHSGLESFKARLVRGNAKWSTKTTKFLAALCTCTYAPVFILLTA